MADSDEALSPDEFVLRRVTACNYDPNARFPIPWQHFSPSLKDHDGLSVFSAKTVTPEQLIAGVSNKHGHIVVKLCVGDLQEMGFTIRRTGDTDGHYSLEELSLSRQKQDRDAADALKLKLAALAAKCIVLHKKP